jgi:phosphoribosylformylglycinamidine cyclo-ligase
MMFWEIFGKIQSYDAAVPEDLIYSGQVKLTDAVENSLDAGQWCFRHQNLCANYQENFRQYSSDAIHGMVHCSGGAQTKILHFVQNLHI